MSRRLLLRRPKTRSNLLEFSCSMCTFRLSSGARGFARDFSKMVNALLASTKGWHATTLAEAVHAHSTYSACAGDFLV